jgi:hypothetical protein
MTAADETELVDLHRTFERLETLTARRLGAV